jgi:hypothetical protein
VDHILAGRGEYIGRNMNAKTDLAPPPAPPPSSKKDDKEEKKPPAPPPVPILNPLTSGETSLIFWAPATPESDDNKRVGSDIIVPRAKTESLLTEHILVDFEGGRTESHRFGTRRWDEEVPTEILVIEPDGRLVAHTLLQDKDDTTRKTRVSAFEKWYKEVDSRSAGRSKGAKAPGSNLFDK